ncbi:hypothetical protein [Amycolatopsis cihanbeyliensis]|uniref:HicB-like protein involved in pilus formation n=1 Tax=Amycolatopsis cihanbeyliensis TaxID=1128664 RepID=A0A542DNR9_AMYCI|nr:hypothetical protein [Amycolatopsis cihanbeyliensis]TQJ04740.1 hypothetical protein FB471_4548 [Amycolatopsis cihanbeyliensis]
MDLTPHVENLGRELATLAETGGDEARELIERLAGSLESAIRMTLLEALSHAADEITRELAPGSIELRLRGRDPDFVVQPPPADRSPGDGAESAADIGDTGAAAPEGAAPSTEEGAMVRLNLRLPEHLKTAVEEAAGKEGRSVNAWLVRAASSALRSQDRAPRPERPGKRAPQRYTGWVR